MKTKRTKEKIVVRSVAALRNLRLFSTVVLVLLYVLFSPSFKDAGIQWIVPYTIFIFLVAYLISLCAFNKKTVEISPSDPNES